MKELSARGLTGLLQRRELSVEELMRTTLARAADVNAKSNAFLTIADEQAIDQAKAKDKRRETCGSLFGLPVCIKDTEPTAGIRTTFGSALFRDNVPEADNAVVSNLKRAGGIVFSKTNTPAFGHIDTTENLLGEPARNPLNLNLTPGGSSGGAAIAVASGVCPIAQGTDGAGSVRIPASLCGIVGFKPSLGRIPHWPVADLWAARTHQGVLAKTVDDVAFAMEAFSQFTPFDPLVTPERVEWGAERSLPGLRALKGLYLPHFGADRPTEDVALICQAAVERLSAFGLCIETGDLDVGELHEWYCDLWQPPLVHLLDRSRRETPELIEDSLHAILERGDRIDLKRHLVAREKRSAFHTEITEKLAGFSYLVMPTLPCTAWPIGEVPRVGGGVSAAHGSSGSRWESMFVFNILGWPAISVPCGYTPAGLPVGLQIVTRKWSDLECLHLGAIVETTTPRDGRGLSLCR